MQVVVSPGIGVALPSRASELAARAALRSQISRLERRLGLLAFELAQPGRVEAPPGGRYSSSAGGARLLRLGELEAVRDELVERVHMAERALERRVEAETAAREALDTMIASPRRHRFEVIERAALGEPGCGAYQVRPRLGLLGMLFGWWCVKLSSGCP